MLVSVIIPTFNRADMVGEAIESVCIQNCPDKEIIVIDDGSTDETRSVVGSFGDKVKYIFIKNRGVSGARNVGIRRAKGGLIAFLDSDDLWLSGKLETQADYFAKNSGICICQTEEIWIRNGKRVNPRVVHKKQTGWIFEHCIPRCIVSPSAVMIRRSVFDKIGLFDEEMPACEDYDLWLRASLRYQIVTLPDPLIIKRGGHEDQLSRQRGLDIWRIYALQKVLKNAEVDPRMKKTLQKDIDRRTKIVTEGARKRNNSVLLEDIQQMLKMYSCHPK